MSGLITKLRGLIVEQIVSRPDPKARALARRFGLNNIRRKPPTLELYFEPGDPHSHLALQALGKFADRLHCPVQVLVVSAPSANAYPEADKQRQFALADASRIAPAWGLQFPAEPKLPSEESRQRANQVFAGHHGDIYKVLTLEAQTRDALFTGAAWPDDLKPDQNRSRAQAELDRNALQREKMGHYLPAMWQFDGEWFWALDRFEFLQPKLLKWGALESEQPLLAFDPSAARLPANRGNTLDFYFSFRSPYSYLAAEYVLKNHQQWPVNVNVKPVLPMAMRGLPVPRAKRLYIVRDVKRAAKRDGYAFGRIADPIGAGAERALTVFNLCEGSKQQLQFLAAAGRAAFAQGQDLATDAGLLHASRQAGLDDNQVLAKVAKGMDLDLAEMNRQDLFNQGLWGVPCWTLGELTTWGYDRRWMLEQQLQKPPSH